MEIKENICLVEKQDTNLFIHLQGDVIIQNAKYFYECLDSITIEDIKKITLDFSKIKNYDTFLYLFTIRLEKLCRANNLAFEKLGLRMDMQDFLNVLAAKKTKEEELAFTMNPLIAQISSIGSGFVRVIKDFYEFTAFGGELFLHFLKLLIHPRSIRWEDFPFLFMRVGVSALFIVLLIVFLIGIISGYQGAIQLKEFGADIYIADLVGISITRELSPLMAAIIVAGRSGSAFAAEIGTMRVSEEIEALRSMGFNIFEFIVMPRVLAVMLALPLLVLLADVAGIFGGMIAAITTLDISVISYLNQLQKALTYEHIFTGVGKSVVFGFLIATAGCFRGLQVSGGAESVGKYTTASVVMSILLIIISDAIFTFLFQALGI